MTLGEYADKLAQLLVNPRGQPYYATVPTWLLLPSNVHICRHQMAVNKIAHYLTKTCNCCIKHM